MEELQKRWSAWIDQRVAAAMADAIKTVADSIGEVIAKERERTRNEIKAAIAVSQGENAGGDRRRQKHDFGTSFRTFG
jgi:hypothetical protein